MRFLFSKAIICVLIALTVGPAVYAVDSCQAIFADSATESGVKVSKGFSVQEVSAFVQQNHLLPDSELNALTKSVQSYGLASKNIANAFLLRVIERVGLQPRPELDAIYNQYYRNLFLSYHSHFLAKIEQLRLRPQVSIEPLFGLDKTLSHLGYDSSVVWTPKVLSQFTEFARQTFAKKELVDVRQSNLLLVQMSYIYARLSGDPWPHPRRRQ